MKLKRTITIYEYEDGLLDVKESKPTRGELGKNLKGARPSEVLVFVEKLLHSAAGPPRNREPRISLDDLSLLPHTRTALKRANMVSLGDVIVHTEGELLSIPTIGIRTLREIDSAVKKRGYKLRKG